MVMQGRWEEAGGYFDAAVQIDGRSAEAWMFRGFCLSRMKKSGEALAALDEAVRLDPSLQEAWLHRAIILGRMGRPVESAECYEKLQFLRAGRRPETLPAPPRPEGPVKPALPSHVFETLVALHEKGRGAVAVEASASDLLRAEVALLTTLIGRLDMDGVVVAFHAPAANLFTLLEKKGPVRKPFVIDLASALTGGTQDRAPERTVILSPFELHHLPEAVRGGLQKIAEEYGGEQHFVLVENPGVLLSYTGAATVRKFLEELMREAKELRMFAIVLFAEGTGGDLFAPFFSACDKRVRY